MTENEARSLAAQREKHKSKHMTHKRWSAVHNSVKGWHVALVDVAPVTADIEVTPDTIVLAVAIALFGPAATVQALTALESARLREYPKGGEFKPNSTAFDTRRPINSGPEYVIPLREKKS